MEAHSLGLGDSFDEVVEELTPVVLTAWSACLRWRFKMVTNCGPVSKNPHRSQTLSKTQSSRAGRVQ